MSKFRVLNPILITAGVFAYLLSAVQVNNRDTHNISIDLSKPLKIEWPFEIAGVGEEGERGLRIGPKIGRGWKNEAGGKAFYRFYVPEKDEYTFWAQSLWHGACSNAIYAKIDNLDKGIIGNNPVYNRWHWVRSFSLSLDKGTHTLELSNHDDNVALRKVFLTNSQTTTPADASEIFGDIFYDGFDGCGRGNFEMWKVISGKWNVQNPCNPKNTSQHFLIGTSDASAMVIMNKGKWSEYTLSASFKPITLGSPDSAIGICFGLKNRFDYYCIQYSSSPNDRQAKIQVLHNSIAGTQLLATFEMPTEKDAWHKLDILPSQKQFVLKYDSTPPRTITLPKPVAGGIGFVLQGKTTAYFDDVHVQQTEKNRPRADRPAKDQRVDTANP